MPNATSKDFTLIEIMIVVLIIGILLAIALPNFVRAREQSRAKSCSANLKQLVSATQQYDMDNKLAASSPTVPDAATLSAGGATSRPTRIARRAALTPSLSPSTRTGSAPRPP